MKKIIPLIFTLFFMSILYSQEKAIKITNQKNKKEKIIKENKRIRIKTVDGQKFSGRFTILENDTILIENKQIALKDIEKIKRNPLGISIATSAIFVYAGTGIVVYGLIAGLIFQDASLFLAIIPASAIIYAGMKSPNFLRGYKKDRNWKYELITITE